MPSKKIEKPLDEEPLEDGAVIGDDEPLDVDDELDDVIDADDSEAESASSTTLAVPPASPATVGMIVPTEFAQMPDAVLSVAMRAYRQALKRGMPYASALFEGVTAGKEWARTNSVSHRK